MEFMDYVVLFFLGLMLLGGLAMIVFGVRNCVRALASSKWPTVPGRVTKSEVVSKRSGSGHDSCMIHSLELTVAYRAGGEDRETGKICYGSYPGSADPTVALLEELRYPVGAEVVVHHHPSDPAMAVLRPGFRPQALGLPGGGLFVAIVGFVFTTLYLGLYKGYPVAHLGFRAFGLCFGLAGAALLAVGLSRLMRARASRTWPVTPGVIVHSSEQATTSDVRRSDGGHIPATSFGVPLAYRYEVEGRTFFSNVRRFGALVSASLDWARTIRERFPLGAEVPVSFDPRDPGTAVLEPGIGSEALLLPGVGLAALLFGAAVLFVMPRF